MIFIFLFCGPFEHLLHATAFQLSKIGEQIYVAETVIEIYKSQGRGKRQFEFIAVISVRERKHRKFP